MPFHIIEGDITTLNTDAIVNAANNSLLGGGGVDGAIHRAAGPKLLQECRTLNGCKTGEAKITDAYNLPSKKVIHTVGPVWRCGNHNEEKLLRSCYKKSLELAKANNLNSIAFPLISSGVYGYPKNQAFKVASETIEEFLQNNDLDIYLVIYDKNSFQLDKKLEKRLSKYIKVNFHKKLSRSSKLAKKASVHLRTASVHLRTAKVRKVRSVKPKRVELSLSERINDRGESFSDLLLRKIDEAHLTDPQCYKKANIDRRLFSKIKNNKEYNPSKETAIALALSLELSLDETNELLEKAGYVLSNNKLFDVIISYFIEHEDFNIYRINEALFHYGQKLLGA